MKYKFDYSKEKDQLLQEVRGIGFKDVIRAYRSGKKLAILDNKSKDHRNQYILIVNIKGYAFASPFIVDHKREKIFLKTVYPSRKHTKKYLNK